MFEYTRPDHYWPAYGFDMSVFITTLIPAQIWAVFHCVCLVNASEFAKKNVYWLCPSLVPLPSG